MILYIILIIIFGVNNLFVDQMCELSIFSFYEFKDQNHHCHLTYQNRQYFTFLAFKPNSCSPSFRYELS